MPTQPFNLRNSERCSGVDEATRILLVSDDGIAPAPTGSGNRVIRWGLLKGLASAGAVTGFYSAAPTGRHATEMIAAREGLGLDGKFWFQESVSTDQMRTAVSLERALTEFRPDIILAYGMGSMRLVKMSSFNGPVGLMSIDLEFMPILHRYFYNLRFGSAKQKLKTLLLTFNSLMQAIQEVRAIRREYPRANFIINHAAHHAAWHARKHNRPTLYTPNPIAPLFQSRPPRHVSSPPRFLLVGGIGGIATLTGLAWFAQRVYPLLETAIAYGELEVHLIGDGELEASLDQRMPHVIRRGYVNDLISEFSAATALLVPTPIALGFRTRIVDAFSHGLTVVAHQANSFGMAELTDGKNALLASTADDFAAAVLRLARSPETAEQLGAVAFLDFSDQLSGEIVARRILKFVAPYCSMQTVDSARVKL